jgi:Flp pilus assembly protein TadD
MKSSKTKRAPAPVVVEAAPKRLIWPYALVSAVALIIVFELYGPALHGPFLYDDSYLAYTLPSFADLPLRAWIAGVRPLLMFTFWLSFQQAGAGNTYPYHVFNVFLHFLNGVLIYLAVRKILNWAKVDLSTSEILSIFAAGLFLFHPIQTEAVTYVASRSDTLSVFFVLAAFVVFLYRKAVAISSGMAVAVLVLFGAAVLSKEHSVALLGLLLLTDYFWNPGFSLDGIRRNWRLYALSALAAVAGLAFVWALLTGASTAGFGLKDFTWYQYFFTQCRAVWVYLRMFVLPWGQNIDHDFPISRSIVDHGAIVGLIALLVLIGLAWYYRRKFPLISYGVFAYLILMSPTSSVIPIHDTLVEHRLYLAFIGLLLITVGLLSRWKTTRATMITALSIVLLAEAAFTYQRNELWGDAVSIWRDSVANSPNKVRPRFQLAFAYYQSGHCAESVDEFGKAAQLAKPDYNLLVDWALASDCAGNANVAITKLKEAALLERTAHVYSQIGMEYAKQKDYPKALDALSTAERIDPNFAATYVYRGNVYNLRGEMQKAAEDYRHALAIEPNNPVAREGLQRTAR